MARKGENIYKRKDGRYEGRYIKDYDVQGKGIMGYVYGKTYKEAKEKLLMAKAKVKEMQNKPPSEMLVKDWFAKWLATQKHIKKSSYTVYSSLISKHINVKLGNMRLCDVTKFVVQDFINGLVSQWEPSTVKLIYTVLKLGLDMAADNGLMPTVCKRIKLPKQKNKEVTVFSNNEQKKIEKYIETSENPNDIGILICLYTGIRIGELCALEWKNIDLKRGVISIRQTLYRVKSDNEKRKTEIIIAPPKSDTSVRDIPLPKFLTAKLKVIEHGGGFLINRKGKYIEPAVYARRYKTVLKEAGVRDVKFHTTRHTFATRALEIGIDIKTLSEILGHASPTVTLNIYAHSLPEHKAKEMDRLGKLYNPS